MKKHISTPLIDIIRLSADDIVTSSPDNTYGIDHFGNQSYDPLYGDEDDAEED